MKSNSNLFLIHLYLLGNWRGGFTSVMWWIGGHLQTRSWTNQELKFDSESMSINRSPHLISFIYEDFVQISNLIFLTV